MRAGTTLSMRLKVITGFTMALLIIAVVGYVSYRSHQHLVDVVSKQLQPDFKLLRIKQVVSDLSDAESSIRAYIITGDAQHLQPYYNLVATIDRNMDSLMYLTRGNKAQQKKVDEAKNLIAAKLDVLNALFKLQAEQHDRDALQKALNSIQDQPVESIPQDTVPVHAESNKLLAYLKGFFQKKPVNRDSAFTRKTEPPLKRSEVMGVLKSIMAEEKLATRQTAYKVLALTREDQLIMNKIKALLGEIEKDELTATNSGAVTALSSISKTVRFINLLLSLAIISALLFVYMIFRDISKHNTYHAALLASKKEAEKLANIKQEFLANMSHEIRTPLSAISGFANQLKQTGLDEEQRSYIKVISNAAEHLVRVVQDVLDFSKIESGKFTLEVIPFSPAELVEELCFSMKPQADQKQLDFYCEIHPSLMPVLKGDPVRLRQIILNLVANAIKFTEKGHVKIVCETTEKNEGVVDLDLRVRDTGIGIAPENQEKIFEEFNQADNTITRRFGGTGLGLAVSRKLVQLQNGHLGVQSEPGKGAEFRVVIPYAKATAQEAAATITAPGIKDYSALKGTTALIADDDPYNLELLYAILTKWGVLVHKVSRSKEAMNLFERNEYDFILLDIQMPEMSGLELVKYFRQKDSVTPVLAVSAASSGQDAERCVAAGMNGCVFKPFKEEELYEHIVKVIRPDRLNHAAQATPLRAGTLKAYDLKALRRTAHNDTRMVMNMLAIFVKNTPVYLQEMETALHNNDLQVVAAVAHRMVPACRHLYIETAVNKLIAIEELAKQGKRGGAIQLLFLDVTTLLQNTVESMALEMKTMEQ